MTTLLSRLDLLANLVWESEEHTLTMPASDFKKQLIAKGKKRGKKGVYPSETGA